MKRMQHFTHLESNPRRRFLGMVARGVGLVAAYGTLTPVLRATSVASRGNAPSGRIDPPFSLPPLPFEPDELEPAIDRQTMEIHHGRHHAAYVNNLNQALSEWPDGAGKSLESLMRELSSAPEKIQTSIRNNGGGHYNHDLFWKVMSPGGGGRPRGAVAEAIDESFGSFSEFRQKFSHAAATRFGSGWAWLSVDKNSKLFISSTPNQDNPLMEGIVSEVGVPILGLDVWEHAYYLQYQNRRADYIEAFWDVVDWSEVGRRLNGHRQS